MAIHSLLKTALCVVTAVWGSLSVGAATHHPVVADSLTRQPLPYASVFGSKGTFLGTASQAGRLPAVSEADYPLTVRYLGYFEKTVPQFGPDTVFLQENAFQLSEIVVNTRKYDITHVLAYVREYSTLSSYTDTVFLFREKMVDFMLSPEKKVKFKTWGTPRILAARSYYRFTDAQGLDSVSDRCSQYFSWTDWVGMPSVSRLPAELWRNQAEEGRETTFSTSGKYSVCELWRKRDENVTVTVDVLADSSGRRWVPNLSRFFRSGMDFERFNVRYTYDDIISNTLSPDNITGYSFNIDSRGRGQGVFRFNRHDEPFFVSTYAEVYILDKEKITVKEARKWEKALAEASTLDIYAPPEAPPLQASVKQLIDRVENINHAQVRLDSQVDLANVGFRTERAGFGKQVLNRVKGLLGISNARGAWKQKKQYREFRRERQRHNNAKEME